MEGKQATVALVAFCALLYIDAVHGGFGLGRCPEKTVKPTVQLGLYAGRWYEISRFGAYFEFNGKCTQTVITPQNDGPTEVVNALVDKTTKNVRYVKGTVDHADDSGDGKLSVTFPMGWVTRTGPYWVLDTDYTHYSVVYACKDFGIAHYESGWILSRTPVLEQQYVNMADSAITANNLKMSQFSTTVQDCGVIDCSQEPCKVKQS